ncbi:type IV pilin [Halobaculum magnesiiphilum]|uniref:Type IV pilin N-terminal domain-containing protein n=1 Tax=Halobaculum magnesiiphilum TaxID=1017351 RepID=A0A8T8WCY1_9EURY|nr:type IV pilin N-terminal domain-containing protein [Halobaculum magnesiiphilum]QZP37698.1 type IV pilin N-terminal domain-containing protein [Halobaculum magnesiiphilum]
MNLASLIRQDRTESTTDERAVSPVIGVILMIAVTVVLAAAIGSFVLGLGDDIRQVTPTASFEMEYAENDDGDFAVTATHQGGATVSTSNARSLVVTAETGQSSEFKLPATAGTSASLDGDDAVPPNTTVRVIWTAPDGGSSQTLARGTTPA